MRDALLVCGRESLRDLHGERAGLANRQRPLRQALAQRLAGEQLRDDERRAVDLPFMQQLSDDEIIEP